MKSGANNSESGFTIDWIIENNKAIAEDLNHSVRSNETELEKLKSKLTVTYWVIISFSSILFMLGIVLLTVPVAAAFSGNIDKLNSIIAAGFGIADLAALFLYGPIDRIHKIMGDMSQIIIVLNSYQYQVSLILIEMDIADKKSVGEAAAKIGEAAKTKIRLIEEYFETKADVKKS
jgi:hypothetical protein